MTTGERIACLRDEAHMTQVELAQAMHISNSALSQYESGTRAVSDELKLRFAAYFGVTLDYLMGLSEYKKAPSYEDAGLSAEEAELLELFRSAPEALQDAALRVLEAEQKESP